MQRGWLNESSSPSLAGPTAIEACSSAIEQLPDEVLLEILAYLDAASLAQAAATSSRVRLVALQDPLWKPFISHSFHSLSPPVRGAGIHPLESSLPLWHPDFGLQADVTHPPSWPVVGEYLDDPSLHFLSHGRADGGVEVDLGMFEGAASLYEVYSRFVRVAEPLLGWWASDVPFYGMVVRIVLDMYFRNDNEELSDGEAASVADPVQAGTNGSASPAASGSVKAKRFTPAVVCQRVYPVNRLQGLDTDMQRWSEVTGFPMPSNAAVISQGTILRRSLTQVRTDLCEPGIRTENLWHVSWGDLLAGKAVPSNLDESLSSSPTSARAETLSNQLRARISSQSWLQSLDPHDGANGHVLDEGEADYMQDEAEQIEQVLRRAADAPEFFNFGFDLEEDVPAATHLRRMILGQHRHSGREQLSDQVSRSAENASDDEGVQISITPWQPYVDANERNTASAEPSWMAIPLPPVTFPPPALLPAVRTIAWSRLNRVRIGMSNLWDSMSAERRWLVEGERLGLDSLTMNPPPPYRPWPIQAHTLESDPRFFPLRNPDRVSQMARPVVERAHADADLATPASLASFAPELSRNAHRMENLTSLAKIRHVPTPPHQDPAHPDFDWNAIEGLYSMTYGPHGIELLYVHARKLTSLDFEPDDRLPAWPAEPLLSDDDMYEQTRISRGSAARVGARVLEAVKVTGDPNIPRGQVTWRAFIDDPGRSAVPWRPPPEGFRKHTPWPLRPPAGISSQEERSPGLVLPAHGRVAGEGFVGRGWATALACVSSIDEIQIWWQPMYKISVAKRLVGV